MAVFFVLIAVLLLLLLVMIFRAALGKKAPAPGVFDARSLDKYAGAEEKLAKLVRIPTVSRFDPIEEDGAMFKLLEAEVSALFPMVSERLLRLDAGDRAMLFEWPGKNAKLKPVILMAHYDVVPPGDDSLWQRHPFSGDIADGYIHGRGTQDIKIMFSGALEAANRLLAEGFVPERTIYLAFGGDEEVGGNRGAASIAGLLKERGVTASWLLDEGGFVSNGMLSFADRPLALVGVAEKGYVDVAISAKGKGGHASMPPKHTAAGQVAKAVALSETKRFPSKITATLAHFLESLSPYVPFAYRLLFRNLLITGPLVRAAFSASPSTNALVRTTTAATMLSASDKENVLPDKARAVLNVRILPGSNVAATMARIDSLASKAGARADFAHHGFAVEPLPESPVDHEGYRNIEARIKAVFPEAGTVPFMFTAGTDTKHYVDITEGMYRFTPMVQGPEDLGGVHGANEKISVENYLRTVMFYEELIKNA